VVSIPSSSGQVFIHGSTAGRILQVRDVSIPSSSGQVFIPRACRGQGGILVFTVSIPSSSGQVFIHLCADCAREEMVARLNPFFIRSSIHPTAHSVSCRVSRITVSIPSSSGQVFIQARTLAARAYRNGRLNPFFIRSSIHPGSDICH